MNEIISDLRNNKKLILTTLDYKPGGFEIDYSMYITARSISSYNNSFDIWLRIWKSTRKMDNTTILVCSSRTEGIKNS